MKLEQLKYYLGTGLKSIDDNGEVINFVENIRSRTGQNEINADLELTILLSDNTKPIFRPWSDVDDLWEFLNQIESDCELSCDGYREWIESYVDNPNPENLIQAPFELFERLILCHFNVFGLPDDQCIYTSSKLNPYE